MRHILSFVLLGVAFAGCDSGGDGPDPDPDPVCGSGLSSQGSFTASVDGASFEANCFEVQTRTITVPGGTADVLTVTGINSTPATPRGEYLGLVTGTASTGVYSIEERAVTATAAEAEYVLAGEVLLAESGTVTITQYSASRIQGSFDAEAAGGVAVTGQFDISY